MKNILFYLLSFVLLSSCQPNEPKKYCHQLRGNSDSLNMESGIGIFNIQHFRDSTIVMPAVSSYDTVYWYRGSGGWGEFDHLCAFYSQNGKWYSELVQQKAPFGRACEKITMPLGYTKLRELTSLIDSFNTKCLPVRIDTIGAQSGFAFDVPHYNFYIKEGKKDWFMRWGSVCYPCEYSKIKAVQEMRTLAAFMLTTSGFPPPQLFYILEKAADGYEAQYFLPDQHLVRSMKLVLGDSILPEREGLSVLKVFKSNDPDIERARAHVELLDGTRLILAPERYKE